LLQDFIATILVLLVEDYSWHAITSFASTRHIGFRQSASVKSILNFLRMKFLVGEVAGVVCLMKQQSEVSFQPLLETIALLAQDKKKNVAYNLLLIQSLCTSRFPS
jgi:hypothetical protein